MKRARLLRVIEYEGDPRWIEKQLEGSIHGVKVIEDTRFDGVNKIKAATLGFMTELLPEED